METADNLPELAVEQEQNVTHAFFEGYMTKTLAPATLEMVRASLVPVERRVNAEHERVVLLALAVQQLKALDPASTMGIAASVARMQALLESPTVLLRDAKGRITGSKKELSAEVKQLRGAAEIAAGLQRCERLLSAPSIAVRDQRGKLIAAKRELPVETEPPVDRITELEKQIAELQSRPGLKYRGTWRADEQFNLGDVCTDHGSAWFCKTSTRARPGADPEAWQLMVKKGRDA